MSPNGFPAHLPGSDLVGSLRRGPTPAGDSITPTRRPLPIVSVRTENTGDNGRESIDDNEATSWTSGERLKEAWIEYELPEPSEVSELTMRLGSWRSRSYPIRVTVDGQEVFAGATPRNLGYVTLPLKPAKGKTVRIQLIGAPRDRDDFDITEITGMKQSEGTDGGKKGALVIVEAELYAPMK
jgi:hypothetical protein